MSTGVRKNRAIIAAGCGAALSLWGVPAAAQSFPTQGTPGAGIGADLVGRLNNNAGRERHVGVEISGQAHYDSNIARGNSTVTALRGVHKDDYIYEPSGKVTLSLPAAGQYLFLEASAGYDYYQYNKLLQRERIDMLAGLTSSLGPCQGSLQGSYNRHQSDLADLTTTVTKNTVQQTSIGVQASCSVVRGINTYVGYEHAESSNSAGTGVVDADVNAVNGGVQYGTRTVGDIGVSVSYSKVNYGNTASVAPTIPAPTGFETTSAQLTFRRPIGNRLVGAAEVGYSKASPTGVPIVVGAPTTAPANKYGGVTGIGSLTYTASSRLQLELSYQRSVAPTIQNGSNFAIQQSVGLQGRYKLTPRLRASLGARVSERNFRDQQITTAPNLVTNDRQRTIFGSIQMNVGRTASLSFDAREEVRNTNLTLFNYTAYRVGVTATQTF